MGEVLCTIKITGSIAAAGKDHIAYAGLQGLPEPLPQTVLIQFLQQAAFGLLFEHFKIVEKVVLHDSFDHRHGNGGKECSGFQTTKGVFQRFNYRRLISGQQFPKVDLSAGTGVGVGNVEHIPQTDRRTVYQQSDAFRTPVDPATKSIPCFNVGTGCSVGLLCVNQNLLTVVVLVVLSGSVQKVHVPAGRGHGGTDFLGCQRNHGLFFARHGQPPTVIFRFTVTLSPVMDANSSPDRALEILVTREFKRHTVSLISS